MKFILFRHGHSLANQESRIVSSLENGTSTVGGPLGTGFGLSQKGKQDVAKSARALLDYIVATLHPNQHAKIKILTSPFQRTQQTANIIHQELCVHIESSRSTSSQDVSSVMPTISLEHTDRPREVLDLRERFFGELEMKTPSDDLYNAVWREDGQNPFHEKFGVESVATVTERMTRVVRNEERGQKDRTGRFTSDATEETWVILVSHGDSLQILQTAMRGWSGDRHRQVEHLETATWRDVAWCEALAEAHH
ncbi:hypothetical protein BGZ72_003374 [Mortierella alpina]|nr:hypothetical protein BGZ72_003374 [Mortierella alpina]